jgi:hypothetical protein
MQSTMNNLNREWAGANVIPYPMPADTNSYVKDSIPLGPFDWDSIMLYPSKFGNNIVLTTLQ